MSLLTKLLEKWKVKSVEELSEDERVTFDRWSYILKGETVTVETLKQFCQAQIRTIEASCNGKEPLTMLQQASLHVYINLLKAIEAPEAERESLERHLTQLIS